MAHARIALLLYRFLLFDFLGQQYVPVSGMTGNSPKPFSTPPDMLPNFQPAATVQFSFRRFYMFLHCPFPAPVQNIFATSRPTVLSFRPRSLQSSLPYFPGSFVHTNPAFPPVCGNHSFSSPGISLLHPSAFAGFGSPLLGFLWYGFCKGRGAG